MILIVLFVQNSLLFRMKFCKQNHIREDENLQPILDENRSPNIPLPTLIKPPLPSAPQEETYRADIEAHILTSAYPPQHPINYFPLQRDLGEHMRGVLLCWLLEVHQKYRLTNDTFYLTVRLLDSFLRVEEVSRGRLQLVGVTAMWIAAKYQETYQVPKLSNLQLLCDNAYRAADILNMESKILLVTGFSLFVAPSPLYYLDILQYRAQLSSKDYALACYLLEATAFDLNFQRFQAPTLAYSIIYFLKKLRGYTHFGEQLIIELCGTNEQEVRAISRELCGLWHKAQSQECLSSLRNKYGHKQYFQVSKIRLTERSK